MKKLLSMIMCTLLCVATLTGCGHDDKSKDISKVDVDKYLLKVGDYKNITLEVKQQVVTDADVDAYIEYYMAQSTQLEPVEGRPAKTGDVANINFEGKKDGVAFDGGTSENYDIEIGSGAFIPGFEDGMIGMEIGETRDLELSFPEEYPVAELAGQEVVFTVKLNSLAIYVQPEFNDEYVKGLELEGISNVAEFKALVKETFEESANATYEKNVQTALYNKLLEICEFSDEVPSGRYSYYYDDIIKSAEDEAASYNSDVDTYLTSFVGYESRDAFELEAKENAYKATRMDLVTYKILELEGLTYSDKDVEKEMEEHFADFGFASVDEFKANISVEDYKMYLTNQKAMEVVLEHATIVEPSEAQ